MREIFEDVGIYSFEALKVSASDEDLSESALMVKGVKKGIAKLLINAIAKC